MQSSCGQPSFRLLNGGYAALAAGTFWSHHRRGEQAHLVGQFLDEYEEIERT